MLEITIPDQDLFNPKNNTFVPVKGTTLQIKHTLVSLKKWEGRWRIPFLKNEEKTQEQFMDYIRCMTLNPEKELDPNIYLCLTREMKEEIIKYLGDTKTATWFYDPFEDKTKKSSSGVITAEIIYYWMIALNIPTEYQYWNLNELLKLIQVVNEKQQPKKKLSHKEWTQKARDINLARREEAMRRRQGG